MGKDVVKGMVFMATATVRKWGNSLAIRIPQDITEKVKYNDGVEVELFVNDNQEILLRPMFPDANDSEALRKHFLLLRSRCKAGVDTHEESFNEPMGDEII